MKKFITLVVIPLIGVLIILFAFPKEKQEENTETLNATIIEITENYIQLEINDENNKTEAIIPNEFGDMIADLEVGDNIIIYYDGIIQETYPIGIPNIEKIEKVK